MDLSSVFRRVPPWIGCEQMGVGLVGCGTYAELLYVCDYEVCCVLSRPRSEPSALCGSGALDLRSVCISRSFDLVMVRSPM